MSNNDNGAPRQVRSPIRVDLSNPAQVSGLLVLGALGLLIAVRQGFRPKIIGG